MTVTLPHMASLSSTQHVPLEAFVALDASAPGVEPGQNKYSLRHLITVAVSSVLVTMLMMALFTNHNSANNDPIAATQLIGGENSSSGFKTIYIIRHGEKENSSETGCLSEQGWARAYNLKSVFGGHTGGLLRPDALFSADYADEGMDCRGRHGWYRTQQTISAVAQAAPGGLALLVDNSTGFMPQLCGAVVNDKAIPVLGPLGLLLKKLEVPISPDGKCFPYGGGADKEDDNAGMCCNTQAAATIKAKLAEPGVDTILVAWESMNIVWLTRALGVPSHQVQPWHYDNRQFDRIYSLQFDTDMNLIEFKDDLSQGFSTVDTPWLGPESGCGAIAPIECMDSTWSVVPC